MTRKMRHPRVRTEDAARSRAIAVASGRGALQAMTRTGAHAIYDGADVATQPAKRPRPFDRKTKKGTSDHLPVMAVLSYQPGKPQRRGAGVPMVNGR